MSIANDALRASAHPTGLAAADVVAAEDTRNTAHLLTHHGIGANRLMAMHQHNERGAAEKIIALLRAGQSVAFVSDAGTPPSAIPARCWCRRYWRRDCASSRSPAQMRR